MNKFESWADVLAYARKHEFVWYHAPLDWRAVRVRCIVSPKAPNEIRIDPRSIDADPFVADEGHLSRFRYPADGRTS